MSINITVNDDASITIGDLTVEEGILGLTYHEHHKATKVTRDNYYYYNGNNGMSVADSAHKATKKIMEMFGESTAQIHPDIYPGCEAIIADGLGRQECYRLAGRIKKLAREHGYFKGVPLPYVFRAIAKGEIKEPRTKYKLDVRATRPLSSVLSSMTVAPGERLEDTPYAATGSKFLQTFDTRKEAEDVLATLNTGSWTGKVVEVETS